MADEEVILGIKTEGADDAVRELERVKRQKEELARQEAVSGSRGFGGMLDGSPERLDELSKVEEAGKRIVEQEKQAGIFGKLSADQAKQAAEDVVAAKGRVAEAAEAAAAKEAALAGRAAAAIGEAKALAGPIGLTYSTLVGTFTLVENQLNTLSKAYPDFEEKNAFLAASIRGLASPWQTVKTAAADAATFILNKLDAVVLGGAIASVKQAAQAAEAANKMKASYEALVKAHAEQNDRMLANDRNYLTKSIAAEAEVDAQRLASRNRVADARDAAAAANEQRAGVSAGEQAVNGVQRVIQNDQRTIEAAQQALDEAYRKQSEAIAARQAAGANQVQAADDAIIAANSNVDNAITRLNEARDQGQIKVEQAGAEAADKITASTEDKLTKLGEEVAAKFDSLAAAPGAKIDVASQNARQVYEAIMADRKITLEEAPKLVAAIQQMTQSTVANSQASQQVLNDAIRELRQIKDENLRLSEEVRRMATNRSAPIN